MTRIHLGGPDLSGLRVTQPAASVRLLLPQPGVSPIEIPSWNGNEFLLASGDRPRIRTVTPVCASERHRDAPVEELLDVDVVIHGEGALGSWATGARRGGVVAVSGPGRGYEIDPEASAFVLVGDESAVPAIRQLLISIPASIPVTTYVEIPDATAATELPDRPESTVQWLVRSSGQLCGDVLCAAVEEDELAPGTRLWAAGEAAAMQRIRRHLSDERDLPRSHTTVRGYWKQGRQLR